MSNIFENQHYTVTVQDITDQNGKVSLGYAVSNKDTSVTEYESFNIVESISYSKEMSHHLGEMLAEAEVENVLHS